MFTFDCLGTKASLNFSILVARFNNFFRVESKNAESKNLPLLIGGNSLIGDFALIKDMQYASTNAGGYPQMQVVIHRSRVAASCASSHYFSNMSVYLSVNQLFINMSCFH